jgi:8-oxo-dGTP diphosphatase
MTPPVSTRFSTARGLITDQHGRWLLVGDNRPYWYIPGGWVDPDERPRDACTRRVFQETGLDVNPGELLIVAARSHQWSLIFDCGRVDSDHVNLTGDHDPRPAPTNRWLWSPPDEALRVLKPAIAERMAAWVTHLGRPGPVYVE